MSFFARKTFESMDYVHQFCDFEFHHIFYSKLTPKSSWQNKKEIYFLQTVFNHFIKEFERKYYVTDSTAVNKEMSICLVNCPTKGMF